MEAEFVEAIVICVPEVTAPAPGVKVGRPGTGFVPCCAVLNRHTGPVVVPALFQPSMRHQ